jgi:hypothetical protein
MHSYLVAVSLEGSQFLQVQWTGSTGEHLLVEGFLHWVKEEGGRFISVERATKGEGAPRIWAHISLDLVARIVRSLLCIRVPLYCITFCI